MIALILSIALVGFITYLIVTYIPMPDIFKTVLLVVVAICAILYVISAFGVSDIPLPRSR